MSSLLRLQMLLCTLLVLVGAHYAYAWLPNIAREGAKRATQEEPNAVPDPSNHHIFQELAECKPIFYMDEHYEKMECLEWRSDFRPSPEMLAGPDKGMSECTVFKLLEDIILPHPFHQGTHRYGSKGEVIDMRKASEVDEDKMQAMEQDCREQGP